MMPGCPVNPSCPFGPDAPVLPVVPVLPAGPMEPRAPGCPFTPCWPVSPVNPVKPTCPASPDEPVSPVKPCGPCCPGRPVPDNHHQSVSVHQNIKHFSLFAPRNGGETSGRDMERRNYVTVNPRSICQDNSCRKRNSDCLLVSMS